MKVNELSHMMQKPEPKPDTYEAGMALNQLLKIGTHAVKIHNMIDDHAEMESWVAKKIDLASNYVKSVHGYTAGQKVGTYDDDGMSEMKRMPKGTGTMQGVKEDTPATDKEIKMAKGIAFDKRNKDNMSKATSTIEKVKKGLSQQPDVADALRTANEDTGEQAMANEIGLFFVKRAKEMLQSMERPNKNDQEYEEYVDIAQAFKKGIQAGLDEVNMSDFEFSNNPFGDFGRGMDDGPDEEMVKILAKHGYQPGPDGANDKATIVRQRDESVSEDAGEGHMSKSQLYQTAKMAIELLDMIRKGDDLEGWVQTKLNLAADYLQAVYHYEDYQKLNPYREEIDTALVHKHAGIIQKHLDEILARETETADVDTKPGMMRILKKRVNEVEKEIAKENRKETNEDTVNEDPRAVGRALANLKYGKEMADAILKGKDTLTLVPKAQSYISSVDQTMELLDKMYSTVKEATIKPYVSMYRGKDGKMVYDVLDKHEKSAFKTSDERVARAYLSKNYDKLRESGILYRAGVKKYGKAGMKAIQSAAGKGASHQEIGKIKDKHLNDAEDLEEGIKEWGKRLAMAGVIVAGLAGVNSINDAIDNSIPAVNAMNKALEMAQDSGNDELAKMIEKDLSDAKVRLSSGKDLGHVAGLQDKYTKFMNTEGMAYESKLAVNLKQRLK
tara:strand:- start:407 stop:2419 length:2013 start_codon:yes stop_codon:yes gene_type:complete